MVDLKTFRILPILGTKTDVSPDDPSMFRYISEDTAQTHDAGGMNFDLRRKINTCVKSEGYTQWSNSAVSGTPVWTLGLFELMTSFGSYKNIILENGRFFYYDSGKDPVQVNAHRLRYDNLSGGTFSYGDTITGAVGGTSATVASVGPNAGSSDELFLTNLTGGDGGFDDNEQISNGSGVTADCYLADATINFSSTPFPSMLRFGNYFIFSHSTQRPYKWSNGSEITPLVTADGVAAFEYAFNFLAEFQGRIIGAYSNQTYGQWEIRWTNALPDFTNLDFPAANQLYKPTTDYITGMSKIGTSGLYLYSDKSIARIVYNANTDIVFSFDAKVEGTGCDAGHSIVNMNGYNYFYNKDLGFVRYDGGSKITSNDIISKDIKGDLQTINTTYMRYIVGKYIPYTGEIVWTIPYNGATSASHLYYYNTITGNWRIEDKACMYIDMWQRVSGEYSKPVFSNKDGQVYQITGETYPSTANIDGYRIEPILDFGNPSGMKHIKEVWFGVTDGGDYSLDLYWRGGNTVKELLAQSWASAGSLSLNNPTDPVIYLDKNAKFHQIKWGTNLDSEKFGVNWINFIYTYEGSRF